MSEPTKLVKATGAMGLATLGSRVLGLVREIVFAAFLGQTLVASAFFFAFTIPNLFRRLLGEGALTAAFVPVLSETLSKEGAEPARRVTNVVASALFVVCCGLCALAILVVLLLRLALPSDATLQRLHLPSGEELRLILSLTQWMMPYMVFVCMAALAMAVLNTRGRFFVPAISPVLLNVAMIGSVFVLRPFFGADLEHQVYALVAGVLFGGLLQWVYQMPTLAREGFRFQWNFQPRDPVVKRVAELMFPTVLGVAVFQINVVTSGALAFFVGDYVRAALNYADRLMELPMGIFGVSVATYALPTLSALYAQEKMDDFKQSLSDALRLLWFLTIPAAVGLMVLAEPIIRLLFERGKFDAVATGHAAFALLFLAPSLICYSTVNVLARAFYAMQDTKTPMKIGVMSMIVNVFLAAVLMWWLKEGGLALANTLSSAMNALALMTALRRRIGGFGGRELFASATRTLFATAIMAGACWAAWRWLGSQRASGFWGSCVQALAPVGVGVAVYGMVASLMRAPELKDVLRGLRKGPRTEPRDGR